MAWIKEYSFRYATLWGLGERRFCSVLASFIAIPALIIAHGCLWTHVYVFYFVLFLFIVTSIFSLVFSLLYVSDRDSSVIVLNRVLGVMLAFWGIPLTLKFIFIGFILFYASFFGLPFLLNKFNIRRLDTLPSVFGILAPDLLAGFVVNLFLRFVLWMVC